MQIILENCGRRFNQDWIFRHCNLTFDLGDSYAILGPNGSGKSTFMAVLMNTLSASEGTVKYFGEENVEIQPDVIYRQITLAAPYLDLVEEFTLGESIKFHYNFKKSRADMAYDQVMDLLGLAKSEDKQIKYFSSGMKQRTKLALAFCSDNPLLFLDEPTANLDAQGIDWYLQLVRDFSQKRLFIVASNQQYEYDFCNNLIDLNTFKPH